MAPAPLICRHYLPRAPSPPILPHPIGQHQLKCESWRPVQLAIIRLGSQFGLCNVWLLLLVWPRLICNVVCNRLVAVMCLLVLSCCFCLNKSSRGVSPISVWPCLHFQVSVKVLLSTCVHLCGHVLPRLFVFVSTVSLLSVCYDVLICRGAYQTRDCGFHSWPISSARFAWSLPTFMADGPFTIFLTKLTPQPATRQLEALL